MFGLVPMSEGQLYWYATKNKPEGERDSAGQFPGNEFGGPKGVGGAHLSPLLGRSSPPAKQKVSFCFTEGQES